MNRICDHDVVFIYYNYFIFRKILESLVPTPSSSTSATHKCARRRSAATVETAVLLKP